MRCRPMALDPDAVSETHGKAAALLEIFDLRGLTATAGQVARVRACTDEAQLDRWIAAALTAQRVTDVLAASPTRQAIGKRARRTAGKR